MHNTPRMGRCGQYILNQANVDCCFVRAVQQHVLYPWEAFLLSCLLSWAWNNLVLMWEEGSKIEYLEFELTVESFSCVSQGSRPLQRFNTSCFLPRLARFHPLSLPHPPWNHHFKTTSARCGNCVCPSQRNHLRLSKSQNNPWFSVTLRFDAVDVQSRRADTGQRDVGTSNEMEPSASTAATYYMPICEIMPIMRIFAVSDLHTDVRVNMVMCLIISKCWRILKTKFKEVFF